MLKICSKFTGETPISKCNFNKITLRHGCSPVNLLHIFRKTSKSTFGGTVSAYYIYISIYIYIYLYISIYIYISIYLYIYISIYLYIYIYIYIYIYLSLSLYIYMLRCAIWYRLHNLKKREKHLSRSMNCSKVAG